MKREEQLLREGARQLGLVLNDRQVSQMILYSEMLADWNTRLNLTVITAGRIQLKTLLGFPNFAATGYMADGRGPLTWEQGLVFLGSLSCMRT